MHQLSPATRQPTRLILNRVAAVAIGFLVILLCRFEVLFDPPYWDHAMGLWPEADELVRTGFDYHRLLFDESTWINGGLAAYRINFMTTYIAFLMSISPDPEYSFFLYRITMFLCAAMLGALVYFTVRKQASRTISTMVTVGVMTSPILCTQIDMLGFEVPVALATTVTAWLVSRHRYFAAAMFALIAMLIKVHMFIVVLAVLSQAFIMAYAAWIADKPDLTRRCIYGLGCAGIAILAASFLFFMNNGDGLSTIIVVMYWHWILPLVWSPDVVLILFLVLWGFGSFLREECSISTRPTSRIYNVCAGLTKEPGILFTLVLALGTLASLAFVQNPLPRYLAFLVPVLGISLEFSLRNILNREGAAKSILLGWIAFNLANWNGHFYFSSDTITWIEEGKVDLCSRREGSLLERTHAYLFDHRGNITAMRRLNDEWDGAPVFAGPPFCFYLSMPSLGCVDRPLVGFVPNGFHRQLRGFRDAAYSIVDAPEAAWFVFSDNVFEHYFTWMCIPQPTANESVIYSDFVNGSPLAVYRKEFADDERRLSKSNWFFRHLGPSENLPEGIRGELLPWVVRDALKRIGMERRHLDP